MVSAIDPSKPVDGVPAIKSDLRANLLAAKTEIEALQNSASASVKQFGAVGNGVANDTAAIQAGIDAIAGSGGVLFFPAGVYLISAAIVLKANVFLKGTYGGTMIKMANGTNINGMFTATGTTPFFGARDFLLFGNGNNQSGQTSRGMRIQTTNTSSGYGTASLFANGNQILDSYCLFENIIITQVDGIGMELTGSYGVYINCQVIGAAGIGISNSQHGSMFFNCSAGSTWHEGWACFGGATHYIGCRAGFTGIGFNPATGTFGNYANGAGFRITNNNQIFVGCDCQDTDGPAFKIQADRVTLLGCSALQPCNLTGISASIGQNPIRGGGYSGNRCAVALQTAKECSITMNARDRLVGSANTPNLACVVDITSGAQNNLVFVGGDADMLAAGAPWVLATPTSYEQQNYVLTPYGPWRPRRTFTANDGTPAVFNEGIFTTNNGAPTTITDFDFNRPGLAIGEMFYVRIADANTTIQNGANIATKSGSNITAQGIYRFIDDNGVWREI
jgi:Pectate lyase superfamily protein